MLSAVPEASDGPAPPPTKLAQELALRSPLVAKYLKSTINELLDDDDDSFSGGGCGCCPTLTWHELGFRPRQTGTPRALSETA